MLFKDTIPTRLSEHLNVTKFIEVLDGIQKFKQEKISESLRCNNFALLMDKKWLLKKLDDYGFSLPAEYPIEIMQQVLLNLSLLYRTRGTHYGVQLYCEVLSLGRVRTINDSSFYVEPNLFLLDSKCQSYLMGDSEENPLYLLSDSDSLNKESFMRIIIESKYFDGNFPNEAAVIQDYINKNIKSQIGFMPKGSVVVNFAPYDSFYYSRKLNNYFI